MYGVTPALRHSGKSKAVETGKGQQWAGAGAARAKRRAEGFRAVKMPRVTLE